MSGVLDDADVARLVDAGVAGAETAGSDVAATDLFGRAE
jgi:hypothetical protein